MKTCSFSGHRRIEQNKVEYVRHELRREIELAIADGFTRFICGFADGTDLTFASIVADLKRENPTLTLEAAIPYHGRMETNNGLFKVLISRCDYIHTVREEYAPDCYRARNKYLAENAQRLIAVFDGREKSGTAQTMRMAKKLGKEIRLIEI